MSAIRDRLVALLATHGDCEMVFHAEGATACDDTLIPRCEFDWNAKARRIHIGNVIAEFIAESRVSE